MLMSFAGIHQTFMAVIHSPFAYQALVLTQVDYLVFPSRNRSYDKSASLNQDFKIVSAMALPIGDDHQKLSVHIDRTVARAKPWGFLYAPVQLSLDKRRD